MSDVYPQVTTSAGFQTYQNNEAYERSLERHAQWVRVTKSRRCPCAGEFSGQASTSCAICKGSGIVYSAPDRFSVVGENLRHNHNGRVYPKHDGFIASTMSAFINANFEVGSRVGAGVVVADPQPTTAIDGKYIQLSAPYPKLYDPLVGSYEFSPVKTVINEVLVHAYDGTFVAPTVRAFINETRKSFGSLSEIVSVVDDDGVALTVSDFGRDLITVSNPPANHSVVATYKFTSPMRLLITRISQKLKYSSAYVAETSDALLITPHYFRVGEGDLFTMTSSFQIADTVIDRQHRAITEFDLIGNRFDVSRIMSIMSVDGSIVPIDNYALVGRNRINWVRDAPTKYSVQYEYNPTFSVLGAMAQLRSSEDKTFIQRTNLVEFSRLGKTIP